MRARCVARCRGVTVASGSRGHVIFSPSPLPERVRPRIVRDPSRTRGRASPCARCARVRVCSMADGGGALAAAAPAPPALSSSPRVRGNQATDYVTRLKVHFSAAAKGLSAEERVRRHEQVVRSVFAGKPGAPDPALWVVLARPTPTAQTSFAFSYQHGKFARGRKFSNLSAVARDVANAVHAAGRSSAPATDDSQLPPSPLAPAPSDTETSTGVRVLAQVQQTVGENGAIAAPRAAAACAAAHCLPMRAVAARVGSCGRCAAAR